MKNSQVVVHTNTVFGLLLLEMGQTNGLSQNWPKGGKSNFLFNKGRDRKKGWDGVKKGGGIKNIYKTFSISLKETQTSKAY